MTHVTIVSIRQILINWTVTETVLGMNANLVILTTMVNALREIINAQFELFRDSCNAPCKLDYYQLRIWVNLKKVGPPFFQIYGMSVNTCIEMSFTQLENHSQLLCGHDFANERLLVCQFDAYSS